MHNLKTGESYEVRLLDGRGLTRGYNYDFPTLDVAIRDAKGLEEAIAYDPTGYPPDGQVVVVNGNNRSEVLWQGTTGPVIKTADAKVGDIIEVVEYQTESNGEKPYGSGRIYKIVEPCPIVGAVTVIRSGADYKCQVAPECHCRLLPAHAWKGIWYRQSGGVWYAYDGNRCIWSGYGEKELLQDLRQKFGITDAQHVPLRILHAQ